MRSKRKSQITSFLNFKNRCKKSIGNNTILLFRSKLQNELRQSKGRRVTSSNTTNRRSGLFSSIFGSGDT